MKKQTNYAFETKKILDESLIFINSYEMER